MEANEPLNLNEGEHYDLTQLIDARVVRLIEVSTHDKKTHDLVVSYYRPNGQRVFVLRKPSSIDQI